jgi:hypothetical protein
MKVLKITTPAGVETVIPSSNIFSVEVTNKLITRVIYENGTTTVNSAIAVYDGTNNRVELGCLIPGNIFTAYVANYTT